MNDSYVYVYIDPTNDQPFYVGKGTGNRAYKHLSETYQNTENKKKYAYIQGLRNKGFEPIIEFHIKDISSDCAYDIEESLIMKYGRKDIDESGILTNICNNNRPPRKCGSDNGFYGKQHSDEVIQRLRELASGRPNANKGKQLPHRSGEGNSFYGKTHTDVTKEKMSKARKLQKPPMLGKKHTNETKDKLRHSNKKQFEDPWQIEIRREKCKSVLGKKLYHHSETGKHRYFFDAPGNEWIRGRRK